jgi:hypothetical protein
VAHYEDYDYDQMIHFLIAYAKHILPGSFEYFLSYFTNYESYSSTFDKYQQKGKEKPARYPSLMLRIAISSYSKTIPSNGQFGSPCRKNIVLMAISAEIQSDHTQEQHQQQ